MGLLDFDFFPLMKKCHDENYYIIIISVGGFVKHILNDAREGEMDHNIEEVLL